MIKKCFSELISQMKNTHRKTAISAISFGSASVVAQGFMIVYSIAIADWLGADQYGYIAASYAATALSAFLFNWGFNQYLMKSGSTHSTPEELGGSVVFIKAVLGIVWGLSIFYILRNIRPEIYIPYILALTIIEVWIDSLFGTLIATLLLKKKAKLASILLISSRFSRLFLLTIFIIYGLKSILVVLLLRLATTIITLVITWLVSKPRFSNMSWMRILNIFKQSSAFNTGELLNLMYIYADVNILVWMGANAELIANYSIVVSLINAIITLPSGIYNVLLPPLTRAYQTKRKLFVQRIRVIYTGFFLLAIGLWVSTTYLSEPLISSVLRDSYSESIKLLVLLSPILGFRTINQANIAYLISVGWQSKRLIPQLIVLILKIGGGIYAVYRMQYQGMVFVTIGAEILLAVFFIIQIIRHYSTKIR